MKRATIALLLVAIPATAFAQEVRCPDCDHVVSYFRGEGGFIGTVADGVDQVSFVAYCGSVTTTGQAQLDGDMASQLFNRRNGLACDREDGAFEIAGLEDGGWFWITDATHSAVGALLRRDVLGNARTPPLDPRSRDIRLSAGTGAVFVKQLSTGRVGLLSTILPVPEFDPVRATRCGGATRTRCMLGDGGTMLAVMGPPSLGTGTRSPILNNTITRPAAGTVSVTTDLWGNGTGHYTTAFTAATANLGQPGGAPLSGTLSASLGNTAPGGTPTPVTAGETPASGTTAGLSFVATISGGANTGTLYIGQDTDYCGGGAKHAASVTFAATLTDAQAGEVTPAVALTKTAPTDTSGVAATRTINIVCP